jgi:hypothetical protein
MRLGHSFTAICFQGNLLLLSFNTALSGSYKHI